MTKEFENSKEDKNEIKRTVSEAYGKIAKEDNSCCPPSSCCDTGEFETMGEDYLKSIGYTDEEIKNIPEGANLSLGCGNPTGIAGLNEGETVLDLGSGAGTDCFVAARKVGEKGKIIGVDMTPEMIEKARRNTAENNFSNVEFRLGEIENLPLEDSSVDVVISNCVINLSADKSRVFEEIYRVLNPGGRILISDIALKEKLPPEIKESEKAYVSCIAGALLLSEYERIVQKQGFEEVKIIDQKTSACIDSFTSDPMAKEIINELKDYGDDYIEKLKDSVLSIDIQAKKPINI